MAANSSWLVRHSHDAVVAFGSCLATATGFSALYFGYLKNKRENLAFQQDQTDRHKRIIEPTDEQIERFSTRALRLMKSEGRLLVFCLISLLSGAVGVYFFQRGRTTDGARLPAVEIYSDGDGAALSVIQTEIDYAPLRKPVLGIYKPTQYLLRLNAFAAQVLRSALRDERSPGPLGNTVETREVADLSQILLANIDEVSAGFDSLTEEERTRKLRNLDRQAQALSDLVAKWQQDKKAMVKGAGAQEKPKR